jgi:hypothetical protein
MRKLYLNPEHTNSAEEIARRFLQFCSDLQPAACSLQPRASSLLLRSFA